MNEDGTREGLRKPLASHVDYYQVFDPQINGSNIDFFQERNGDFLVIEFKRVGERLRKGQEIALKALSRKPGFTVIIYTHDSRFEGKGEFLSGNSYNMVIDSKRKLNDYVKMWGIFRGLYGIL